MGQLASSSMGWLRIRPPILANWFGIGLFAFCGLFFLVAAIIGHAWRGGPPELALAAVFVLGFGIFPSVYLLTQEIWIDSNTLGIRRGFRRHTVRRDQIKRVVGVPGRILFMGSHDQTLLFTNRFWTDDQMRAICAELGIKPEGVGRLLNPIG
jgi:hypothetical protein